jgi:hypothetical protein
MLLLNQGAFDLNSLGMTSTRAKMGTQQHIGEIKCLIYLGTI